MGFLLRFLVGLFKMDGIGDLDKIGRLHKFLEV